MASIRINTCSGVQQVYREHLAQRAPVLDAACHDGDINAFPERPSAAFSAVVQFTQTGLLPLQWWEYAEEFHYWGCAPIHCSPALPVPLRDAASTFLQRIMATATANEHDGCMMLAMTQHGSSQCTYVAQESNWFIGCQLQLLQAVAFQHYGVVLTATTKTVAFTIRDSQLWCVDTKSIIYNELENPSIPEFDFMEDYLRTSEDDDPLVGDTKWKHLDAGGWWSIFDEYGWDSDAPIRCDLDTEGSMKVSVELTRDSMFNIYACGEVHDVNRLVMCIWDPLFSSTYAMNEYFTDRHYCEFESTDSPRTAVKKDLECGPAHVIPLKKGITSLSVKGMKDIDDFTIQLVQSPICNRTLTSKSGGSDIRTFFRGQQQNSKTIETMLVAHLQWRKVV